MSTPSLVLILLYVLSLLASANAGNGRKRPNRMPTELRKFNITFLRGTFAFGPSTQADVQCENAFNNPILPSTLQVAFAAINNTGQKTAPGADTIITLQQINGTGLLRNEGNEVRIIARGPVFRGRYVFIVFFDGTDMSAIVSNRRFFNRFFKRRVIRFIRRFRIRRVRNLLRNRSCRRILTRKFIFPTETPGPQDPQPQDPPQDPQPQDPTPEPQDLEQDPQLEP